MKYYIKDRFKIMPENMQRFALSLTPYLYILLFIEVIRFSTQTLPGHDRVNYILPFVVVLNSIYI